MPRDLWTKLLGRSFASFAGRVANGFFVFLVNAVVVRATNPQETANFFLISSALWLLVIVVLWGSNHSIFTQDESEPTERIRRTAGMLVFSIPVAIVVGFPLLYFFNVVDGSALLGQLIFCLVFITTNGLLVEYARLMGHLRWAFFAPALTQVFWLALIAAAYFTLPPLSLNAIFAAQWLANALISLLCTVLLFGQHLSTLKFEAKSALHKRQLMFLSLNVSLFVVAQIDLWMTHLLAAPAQVAQYGVAMRFMAVVMLPMAAIHMAFIGDFSHATNDEPKRRQIRAINRLSFLATFLGSLTILAVARILIPHLFGEGYDEAWWIFLILTSGLTFNSAGGTCGYLLLLNNCRLAYLASMLCGMVVVVAGAYALFPAYGVRGIALAAALGLISQTLINVGNVHRRLKFNWFDLLRL